MSQDRNDKELQAIINSAIESEYIKIKGIEYFDVDGMELIVMPRKSLDKMMKMMARISNRLTIALRDKKEGKSLQQPPKKKPGKKKTKTSKPTKAAATAAFRYKFKKALERLEKRHAVLSEVINDFAEKERKRYQEKLDSLN